MISFHFVFCPKYRKSLLAIPEVRRIVDYVFKAVCEREKWKIIAFKQMPDHLHLLLEVSTTDSPDRIAQYLKGASSRELRKNLRYLHGMVHEHFWAARYHVDSVGLQNQETISHYIDRQEEAWKQKHKSKAAEPVTIQAKL